MNSFTRNRRARLRTRCVIVLTMCSMLTGVATCAPAASAGKAGSNLPAHAPKVTPKRAPCVGVKMTRGQADINAALPHTTFCLSGKHNWTLTPKSGDKLIGPAILNGTRYGGGPQTEFAIRAVRASNVVLQDLEIRNYAAANQRGAISPPWDLGTASKRWKLINLQVHDNGTAAGGAGASLGTDWQVIGGRYYNNRQEGIGGSGDGSIVDGVEIDHNNFTNHSYTTQNTDCGFEAGGFKWVASRVTVKNSRIHDNACRGLWTDGGTHNAVITNNRIYNNWDSGIFVEISTGATITRNTVYNNGFRSDPSGGCSWLWAGGITIASSDHVSIAYNNVYGNCNGITGTQQNRPDGHPGLLQYISVHDNRISGPRGTTGVVSDNGANLTTRKIVFASNTITNGMHVCGVKCA